MEKVWRPRPTTPWSQQDGVSILFESTSGTGQRERTSSIVSAAPMGRYEVVASAVSRVWTPGKAGSDPAGGFDRGGLCGRGPRPPLPLAACIGGSHLRHARALV